ncbi:amino acid adenylation domain-containing protein [Tolypothrix sp. NIES-4075]|uniref:non-ribosomal peptide synthetase n=1 Tax=Tolypothrix sp. NIES-4075 TaxID=2005459 RepID=UPI000B5C44BD|nr:non-ribosomal peptide synthetase [Tolypothrix sp. NIES-4075]GAX43730.1 amino acid adenylation domain-containing protein [Tolypothrix sp. NIES-4075]
MEVYVLPLSLAQRQIWYQEIICPGNVAYNIPIALRLIGDLDRKFLEEAFRKIISRHEILRTTFAIENGEPVQLIHAEQEFYLEQKIITSPLDVEKELAAASHSAFNLVKGPLMRGILYQIQPREHILMVNLHHIISDGWSLGIFVKELTQFYSASVTGLEVSLPELPIQYGDYAEWQETWLQEESIKQQLNYWEKALFKPLPVLDLPLDKLRPASQTFNGAVLRVSLPVSLTSSVAELAKVEGATFFMVALAVYQVLLYRYSGETDIIVGSAIANRRRSELDNLVGCFVNTLPLRGDLDGQLTFRQFLRQISQTCVEAYAHQDVPLELLIEKLEIKRDPSRSPIFQTLFALQNAPIGEIQLPGLTITPIYLDSGGAKFDLSLMLEPLGEGWQAALEYNTDLFTSETAERILTHYQQLLTAAINTPDVGINALPLLTASERQELLITASETCKFEPANLVELFINSARTHHDRIAVSASEKKLTYQELDQRSNQLAYVLQQKGVRAETRVGIFLERSEALVISLLAVLKAGGTYVPLDPQYPPERLRFIAEDSEISLLLTEEALLGNLPAAVAEIVVIDKVEFSADITFASQILPTQAAYIIYTSGSTGQPKGCLVTHSNVVRLMRNTEAWFGFNENDVWTLFHSFAFDFSVWEIWGALLYGGKLVVVPYLESRSPEAFRTLLLREKVTILNQTPSAFRQLIRADKEAGDKLVLRAVIFGGEALELQSLKPWIERYGADYPRLINMYGITETTVHVTYRPILEEDIQQNRGSVIGVPIPDLSLYILDEALEPTPIGVAGEIYVGGMGVSRGYLNRPKLTAERFIPNCFKNSKLESDRLYKTGDLARRLPNGDIEYLGRRDLQVKVRGFRIELGEIEAALIALPQVAEAVVVTHSETEENKRLVAYIVANGSTNQNQLRALLKERLPDYMIPAALMFIDVMPLTAQGKIDRKALPVTDWNQSTVRRSLIPPQTAAEKVICAVWETVLGLDAVGVEDNFFDLGGDSILALRVVTEIRRQGWVLTPKEIFQEQTVKRLAGVLKMVETRLIASVQGEETRLITSLQSDVPLSPIQRWFFALNLPNPNHWNQALLLEVNKSLEAATVAAAIKAIAAHHDSFRLRFEKSGVWRQFYTKQESGLSFEIVDLTLESEFEQNAAMQKVGESLQRSLDLNNGPLARAVWFNLGENRLPRLLIIIHHLIIDGVSWRILLQDLAEAISNNQVEAPTSSFQQWSQFLQNLAKSPEIQAQKQFWLDTLKEETALIPLDFPVQTQVIASLLTESSVKTVSLKLTKEQTNIFLTKANKAYHTQPQELLLTALTKTLRNITQGQTLQIMMEGHGREELSSDLDITRTLGWFTTLYPLRLQVIDEENLIKTVKQQLRSVPQRGFGYGLLRYLQNDDEIADIAVSLPAQISFNYLGQVRNESGKNKLFRLLNEDTEPARNPEGLRPHIIDVIGIVVEGELRVDWLYSSNLHSKETIAKWADDFQQNLLQILTHCMKPGVGGYTPSDFPLVSINQSSVDILQEKFPELEDIYPLSPLQSGMLFHTIYDSEDGIYVEQVTGKIIGNFDVSAFAFAWQTVVDRHPILRSAMEWENQETPLQIVSKHVKFSLLEKDWRDLSPTQQEDELKQYLIEDRKNGFLLNQPLLMRFTIIRLDDSTWQWIWSHHHIILDGWSLPVIFKEVLAIYQSTIQRVPHSLAPVPPYRNYIHWLASRNRQQAKQFWQETLHGISTSTRLSWQLPEDREIVKAAYQEEELRLSQEEFALLQKMAQNHRLTLNTLAQGAWALCLQKHGAGEDVIFGVTVSGRPPELTEVENMVGLFINTLPMRVRLNPNVTVVSWLENIQQCQVQMREYEYSKLTDIQKEISLAAGESLFESILVFENYPVDKSLKEQGQDFQVDEIQSYERTNYPLTLSVIPDSGLLLKLNYQTKFLSATAAKTLLERLRNIMVNLAHQPDVALGEIHISAINQENTNSVDWGDFQLAHQLFEEWADLHPNAVALVFEDDAISYSELEKRANQLAAILISAGIGNESIVGLYFNPCIEFIIALIAVLKAGGAFLPLDCSYPEARLKFIVEDSQTHLILTKETPAPGLFPADVKIIPVTEVVETRRQTLQRNGSRYNALNPRNALPRKPPQRAGSLIASVQKSEDRIIPPFFPRPKRKIRPENLAYIIYTSGSTGKPKGVLVTHAGIQNMVRCQISSFGVTAESRVYQFASLNFDAAIFEIFMALGSGASLYLQEKANRSPSSALWSALTAWKITHSILPPSLLAAIERSNLPQLQTLIVGGEAASGDLLRRWGGGERSCFNAYGPTEATVYASLMDCSHLLGEPSIGKAIANVEIYLLDSFLQPVVPGVTGEIYIGGIGLARGYLNRPNLTAAAFIPHPFAKQPGARLYKTGDRGVYDLQGNIRFLGRQDEQVKLNGYRIELGEIEAALTRHEAIDSAVVMLRQDVPGRKRLIAYALTPQENPPTANELRDYLAEVLPAYMVPSAVILLKEWLLTPNGKIDRKALPAPELPTSEVIPKNQTEEILANIWAEVLGLESVNLHDNFFELGGDSIISLQIVSRAREKGWEINPRDIFEAQTLSRLAAKAKLLGLVDTRLIASVLEPLTGNVSLAPIQHWFFAQNLPHPHYWNQVVAISLNEPLNIDALLVALNALVAYHDVFRLGFCENQGNWEQFYTGTPESPKLRIEDFSNYPPSTQQQVLTAIVEEEHGCFQLAHPPLLRLLYAKNLSEYGNVLYLFGHHLIVDGVSWRILIEDLHQAYQQAIANVPISLPLKTSSYRQWTSSLQTLADSGEITKDISFWQKILSTSVSPLPVDYPVIPGSNTVKSAIIQSCQLSPEETIALLKQATATYHAGVQEILLAALLKTLTDTYKSDNWLINLEGHGREQLVSGLDLSRTVGWFTSLYPILLKKPAGNAYHDMLLKEVKTQLRAIPHYGISFGLLRYLSQNETFTNVQQPAISFNYLGQIEILSKSDFSLSNAPTGVGLFPEQERPHLLAINAHVQSDRLQINWTYSQHIHRSQTIHHLAESYLNNLRLYLTNSTSTNFYSATDFHLVDLSESELDSILEDLS